MHISGIKLPEGCKSAVTKTDLTVVTIVPPTVYKEDTPTPAATAAATTAPAAGAAAPAAGAAPAKGAAAAPAKAPAAKK